MDQVGFELPILKIFWEGKKSCDCCGEIRKGVSEGGFGGAPGFPILSDRDLSFSASLGVARCFVCSFPLFSSSKLQLLTPGGVALLPGRPSSWTCRAPCATWLRTGPTSPGASTDPFHLHIYIPQLLLFKERDRDPSAGAGFPPL